MEKITQFYKDRINSKTKELISINKNYNIISFLRLLTVISEIIFIYYCYKNETVVYGITITVLHIALFIALADVHDKIAIKRREARELIKLNENEIKRIDGNWKTFEYCGSEYLDVKNPFINDLDIFGQNSLFQWINNTRTVYGKTALSNMLMIKNKLNKIDILEQQKSLQELAEKIDFRYKLLIALTPKKEKSKAKEEYIYTWVKERDNYILSKLATLIRMVIPGINILIIALTSIKILPWPSIILSLGVSYIFLNKIGKEVNDGLLIFQELKYKVITYVKAMEAIENEQFSSEKLKSLQKKLKGQGKWASDNFKELERITTWLYDRGNAFYILFNGLFLWDYQMIYRLENWRRKNSNEFDKWMETLGEFEALTSLSSLIFNNPDWCVPEISEENVLRGENISHPMLGEKGVSNTFIMNSNNRVLLITGSNMSGKSTFLRTVGFNVILSYLGLNVKATSFTTPILNVYTCMRTGDNLEQSISSFYAEILRIKNIVDGTKKGEKILFLLDEIFKGTNSLDRHLGAKVLIEQLLKGDTLGLVSTHDLELCDMEKNNTNIVNYNFREYYEDNKLKFDYKLRLGASQTRNAKYLMKMAGIEID